MKLLYLLVFASLTLSLHGEYTKVCLAKINFNAIQKAQGTIESLIKWRKFYQYITVATIVTGAGAAIYGLYQLANLPEFPKSDVSLDQEEMRGLLLDMRVFLKHWKEKHHIHRGWIMSQLHWLKKTVIQNFNSILIGVGATMVFNVMNNTLGPVSKYIIRLEGFLDNTVSGIFHENSLDWFINNQANLIGFSSILKQYSALVEGKQVTILQTPLSEEKTVIETLELSQRQKALQDFVVYWKLFTEQVELVLAFINYKGLTNSNKATCEQMVGISTKIHEMVNLFATNCEGKIEASQDGTILLYDDFLNLTAKIAFEFQNFRLLDTFKRLAIADESKNV